MGSLCTYQCLIWRGGGRSSEGRRFDKESRPVVWNFWSSPSPKDGDFWIFWLWTPSWEDLVTSRLSVALSGVLGNQRWWPLFSQGSVSTFYAHVQDSSWLERDKISIFILSILIQINASNKWWLANNNFMQHANEKLKGCEKQNSTTGFTVIKVHNAAKCIG